jgi:hypothetical protein
MMILAGGGNGVPLDYPGLELWTRVGFDRGMRSRKGERELQRVARRLLGYGNDRAPERSLGALFLPSGRQRYGLNSLLEPASEHGLLY